MRPYPGRGKGTFDSVSENLQISETKSGFFVYYAIFHDIIYNFPGSPVHAELLKTLLKFFAPDGVSSEPKSMQP